MQTSDLLSGNAYRYSEFLAGENINAPILDVWNPIEVLLVARTIREFQFQIEWVTRNNLTWFLLWLSGLLAGILQTQE